MKTKHCVQKRELPAGSRAGRSCSAVWGRKAGGLPAQPSPTAKPQGKGRQTQGKRRPSCRFSLHYSNC